MPMLACPYPNCQHPAQTELAGSVYCCAQCQRLALACRTHRCQTLNRPLSRHCRCCGEDLLVAAREESPDYLWREAGRFDDRVAPVAPQSSDLLGDLSDLQGYRRPSAAGGIDVEMSFCDGLLALHQAGRSLALFHPLGSAQRGTALLWSAADAAGENVRRPFPPLRAAPGRFLVFSAPHAVHVVDAWSLPGWSITPGVQWWTVFHAGSSGFRLAAQAVPLGDDKLGLLLVRNDRYHWGVLDLNRPIAPLDVSQTTPLEIAGTPCQWRLSPQRALLLLTPQGQWAWRLSDAALSQAAGLLRTPRGAAEGSLLVDRQLEDPRLFSWSRQAIDDSPGLEGAADTLVCYYQRRAERGGTAEYYGLDLRSWQFKAPQAVTGGQGAVPLGLRLSPDGLQQMTFLRGRDLFYDSSLGELAAMQIMAPGSEQISGLRFFDPLLLLAVAGRPWSVDLLSVRHPNRPLRINDLALLADPLVWSRWLFTCERDGQTARLLRRDLSPAPRKSTDILRKQSDD